MKPIPNLYVTDGCNRCTPPECGVRIETLRRQSPNGLVGGCTPPECGVRIETKDTCLMVVCHD